MYKCSSLHALAVYNDLFKMEFQSKQRLNTQ